MESRVVVIRGPLGSWKSSLALSWKSDYYKEQGLVTSVLDLELGAHRAFAPNHEVRIWQPATKKAMSAENLKESLMFTKGDKLLGKREYFEEIVNQYVRDLQDSSVGCIVFDTAKEFWTADHQGYLQELQEHQPAGQKLRQSLQPVEYAVPNGRFNNLVYLARNFGKDLVLLNHERAKYVTQSVERNGQVVMAEVPSGEMELDGFKGSGDLADWMFVTKRNKQGVPEAVIAKSPVSDKLLGQLLTPPTYEYLIKLLKLQGLGV